MDTYENENPELQLEEVVEIMDAAEFQEEILAQQTAEDTVAEDAVLQPAVEKPARKKKSSFLRSVLITAAISAVCCALTVMIVNEKWENKMYVSNQVMGKRLDVLQQQIDWLERINTQNAEVSALEGQMSPSQVYSQNVKAVVAIAGQSTTTNIYGQVSQTASSGSGFVISADGYVVTNYHVIEGSTEVSVLTYDGEVHAAKIVGYDSTNDLCVLKIDAQELSYVEFGSSEALGVGEQVVAIGNPLGELTSTLTVGYVSAKDRVVTTEGKAINMLQTDAAINSGNSGGPLFDMSGKVVGITTAKYSGTSNSGATIEGIGFAIPIDDVADMIRDLQENGYISTSYLGVVVRDVAESAQMYGLPAGAYVEQLDPGYAAEEAGIQVQDIIVNIGGHKVTSLSDLSRVLRKFEPGEATTITVYRTGQYVDMPITMDEKPAETPTVPQETQPTIGYENQFPGSFFDYFFGN